MVLRLTVFGYVEAEADERGSGVSATAISFMFSGLLFVACLYVAQYGVGYFAVAAVAAFFASWGVSHWAKQRSASRDRNRLS